LVSVQQEIAGDIYGRLRPRLARLEEIELLARSAPTENAEAYHSYLAGSSMEQWTQNISKRLRFSHPGRAEDSALTPCPTRLSCRYHSLLGDAGYLPPSEAWPKAKAAAMQALDIDDSLAEAHHFLVLVKEHFECRDWRPPSANFKRCHRGSIPESATAHHCETTWRT